MLSRIYLSVSAIVISVINVFYLLCYKSVLSIYTVYSINIAMTLCSIQTSTFNLIGPGCVFF